MSSQRTNTHRHKPPGLLWGNLTNATPTDIALQIDRHCVDHLLLTSSSHSESAEANLDALRSRSFSGGRSLAFVTRSRRLGLNYAGFSSLSNCQVTGLSAIEAANRCVSDRCGAADCARDAPFGNPRGRDKSEAAVRPVDISGYRESLRPYPRSSRVNSSPTLFPAIRPPRLPTSAPWTYPALGGQRGEARPHSDTSTLLSAGGLVHLRLRHFRSAEDGHRSSGPLAWFAEYAWTRGQVIVALADCRHSSRLFLGRRPLEVKSRERARRASRLPGNRRVYRLMAQRLEC